MKKLRNFIVYGNLEKSDNLEEINELSITGCAESFKALGLFFIQCSIEMKLTENWDHAHFLYSGLVQRNKNDVDIICIMDRKNMTKATNPPKNGR